MKENLDLFKDHLEALKLVTIDSEKWLSHFTSDAVIEFPYAHSIGSAGRLSGYDEIRTYIKNLAASGLNFESFQYTDLKIFNHTAPYSFTAELKGVIPSQDGKPEYRQHYICIVETKEGKISFYKEFWNPYAVKAYLEE